jgi:hypothetical protein
VVVCTIVTLLYSILCRATNIYFFWESQSIGITLIFISLIFVLSDLLRRNLFQKTNARVAKIAIGFAAFVLLIEGILFVVLPRTDAYEKAIHFIHTSSEISSSAGTIEGSSLIPFGGMALSKSAEGTSGQASFHFIVKGSKKYVDLELLLEKQADSDWQVNIVGE